MCCSLSPCEPAFMAVRQLANVCCKGQWEMRTQEWWWVSVQWRDKRVWISHRFTPPCSVVFYWQLPRTQQQKAATHIMGCLRYVWWKRKREKRRIGWKDKDGKCVYGCKRRWNGLEEVEGDGAPDSSGISHTINSVCRGKVAMVTPLYIPYTKVSMVTGAFARHFGVPRTHSIAHCWVAARMLGILQRPSCHSHITFPWEPTPVACCEVVMETAHGQVAEDKWGDVRVSRRRLKRPVLYLQRWVSEALTQTLVVCHALMQLQTRAYDRCHAFDALLGSWDIPSHNSPDTFPAHMP